MLAVLSFSPEGVGVPDHVEDDAVVGRVPVMAVGHPVPGADVDFHVSPEQTASLDVDGRIQEVGTRATVAPAGEDDLGPRTIDGAEPSRVVTAPCPHAV